MTSGWVYILTNPSMPGLVKIGFTSRNPTARAAELAAATGVPTPFVIAWCRAVSDCAAVESAVHRMLDDRRISGKREFFRCDVLTGRQVIEAAAGAKIGRHYRPRLLKPSYKKRRQNWRRGGDSLPAWLAITGAAFVLLLAVFKPPLPTWLPASVSQGFAAVERLS